MVDAVQLRIVFEEFHLLYSIVTIGQQTSMRFPRRVSQLTNMLSHEGVELRVTEFGEKRLNVFAFKTGLDLYVGTVWFNLFRLIR